MRLPQAVLVAYRSPLWLKVAIGSFLAHVPEQEILVVDNNPPRSDPTWHPDCEEERQWLNDHRNVVVAQNSGSDRTHGAGLDLALAWCREHGRSAMLHFEPDCYVSGVEWYRQLTDALARGAWMASGFRKAWGPLHPCPSIWDVDRARTSFRRHDGQSDVAHPRFAELFSVERYRLATGVDVRTARWRWDTGLKAWFDAAIADRAVEVSAAGLAHYWRGSEKRREDLSLFLDPRLLRYARPTWRRWTQVMAGKLLRRPGRTSTGRRT